MTRATPRTLTPEQAAGLLAPRDSLAVPLGPGQPPAFLEALGAREDWEDLRVFSALLTAPYPLFTRPGVRMRSGFFGPVERALVAQGGDVQFVPADFRRFRSLARVLAPRVMATAAAPPDARGRLSLSLHAGATVEELHACGLDPERLLVVEVNPHLPRTLGTAEHPHFLSLSEVDVLIESDREPLALPDPAPSEVDRRIAEHARRFVEDGCTLQTGIGAIPSTIAQLLAEGPGGDYGIHSEMFTTGLMHLHQAGKVSNRKGIHDGYSITTFAMGSRELYDWLDGNEAVRFLPVEEVNTPSIIGRNRKLVSINGALAVDRSGQVAADTLGPRQYSGIGGHEDFVEGAGSSLEDRSLICVPATATVGGELRSRIVPGFEAGTTVTTPRHQVDVVVTEYGVAELFGLSVRERAEALAAITHPAFRDELLAGGSELG